MVREKYTELQQVGLSSLPSHSPSLPATQCTRTPVWERLTVLISVAMDTASCFVNLHTVDLLSLHALIPYLMEWYLWFM